LDALSTSVVRLRESLDIALRALMNVEAVLASHGIDVQHRPSWVPYHAPDVVDPGHAPDELGGPPQGDSEAQGDSPDLAGERDREEDGAPVSEGPAAAASSCVSDGVSVSV
jgi:hypothetical protein